LRKGTRSSSASFLAAAASAGAAAAAGRAGLPGARPGRPARCAPPACDAPPRQWRPGPRRGRRQPPCQGPGPGCRPLAGLPAGCGGLQAAAARWCASVLTGWHLRVSALGQKAGAAGAGMDSDGAARLGLSNKSRCMQPCCVMTMQPRAVRAAGLEQARPTLLHIRCPVAQPPPSLSRPASCRARPKPLSSWLVSACVRGMRIVGWQTPWLTSRRFGCCCAPAHIVNAQICAWG